MNRFDDTIEELKAIDKAEELVAFIFRRFGNKAAIGTSGQLTGVAMVDMAVTAGQKPRVFTIDTERLFPETYQLFESIEKKYSIKIEKFGPDKKKIAEMIKEHGEYLFFDSKEKQEYCCHLRKVEPNERALSTVDVWLTGLRADQSAARKATPKFQVVEQGGSKHSILKVAPLIDWTEAELREYAQEHEVPIHPLLNWNHEGWYYESLGCVICTTPIGPYEARRAGRWRWFKEDANKECGLHVPKKDEI